jgi:HEAT repeat protein
MTCFLRSSEQMRIISCLLAIFCIASLAQGFEDESALALKVGAILERFPGQSSEERDHLAAELMALGEPAIHEACRRLSGSSGADDSRARFALNGLAVYVSRAGAEAERKMFVRVLIKALERGGDAEVQAFLMSQLQLAGREESVKPLSRFLAAGNLCDPASRGLVAIGTREAEKALLRALDTAGSACGVAIIKSLGELRSREDIDKILKYAESRDDELRQAALFALARSGHPGAEPLLQKVSLEAPAEERERAPELFLLYARRLAESGHRSECLRICRRLISYYRAPHESHIASHALSLLVEIAGEEALDDLLSAADSPAKELRAAAFELAAGISSEKAVGRLIEKLAGVQPEVRAEILTMLGRTGSKSALPVILQALESSDKIIRMAGIPAAARLAGTDILEKFFGLLRNADPDESEILKESLLLFPASAVVTRAAQIFEEMPSPAKAVLIDIIAEKQATEYLELVFAQTKGEDTVVRLAALAGLEHLVTEKDLPRLLESFLQCEDTAERIRIQKAVVASARHIPDPEFRADPILEKIVTTEGEGKSHLIRLLSGIGGKKALDVAVAEARNQDPVIQGAAVSALASWPTADPIPELLQIAREAPDKQLLSLAVRGYLRLVSESIEEDEARLSLLKEALVFPLEPEDRGLVLAGLASVRTLESLRLASPYLLDENLKAKAARAIAEIALPADLEEFGLRGPEVISALKRAALVSDDAPAKMRMEKYIEVLLKSDGFVPLFDGRDLSGWKGLVGNPLSRAQMAPHELEEAQNKANELMLAHWKAMDGTLVFDGRGESLCTEKEYRDFELFVDWKIEPQGDSGIYLRGSPQVQIWDPAQWPEGSGGLYNNQVHPNKPLRLADNPPGEWNTFWIRMVGEKVTVYLNHALVADDVVMENYWERDKPIYAVGQIELQAHSTPLYFRNIFIRELNYDNN